MSIWKRLFGQSDKAAAPSPARQSPPDEVQDALTSSILARLSDEGMSDDGRQAIELVRNFVQAKDTATRDKAHQIYLSLTDPSRRLVREVVMNARELLLDKEGKDSSPGHVVPDLAFIVNMLGIYDDARKLSEALAAGDIPRARLNLLFENLIEHWPRRRDLRMAEVLLQAGADPNHVFYSGDNACRLAVMHLDAELFSLLIGSGADPGLPHRTGRTVMDLVGERDGAGKEAILKILRAKGIQSTTKGVTKSPAEGTTKDGTSYLDSLYAHPIPEASIIKITMVIGSPDFACSAIEAAQLYDHLNPSWSGANPITILRVDSRGDPPGHDIKHVVEAGMAVAETDSADHDPADYYLTLVQYFNLGAGGSIGPAAAFITLVARLLTNDKKQVALMMGNREIPMSGERLELPTGTEELIALLKEAEAWFQENKNADPGYRGYPQYENIRAIGQRIYESGGHQAMQRASYFARSQYPRFGYRAAYIWDGIGEWMS